MHDETTITEEKAASRRACYILESVSPVGKNEKGYTLS
jgi:hypothetical protein